MKKMKNELPQVGFEPTTLCTPDRCSYQHVHDVHKHVHIHKHVQVHVQIHKHVQCVHAESEHMKNKNRYMIMSISKIHLYV